MILVYINISRVQCIPPDMSCFLSVLNDIVIPCHGPFIWSLVFFSLPGRVQLTMCPCFGFKTDKVQGNSDILLTAVACV